ncbi:copper resistance protein B [Sinimarinibacterium sp. NLF-5-8]|uniref:copper resistance protein B n=1 Tax=Sinimarinibacterium sp. NLF-5-8 TaxID=2698684 RepID=UPI00192E770C|nr:copper resistance protein B [Sinimarinibacterium sp. NLF-5-8]
MSARTAVVLLALVSGAAQAQHDHAEHAHEHEMHEHMDHAPDHADHSDVPVTESEPAPTDARDPHAYSNGLHRNTSDHAGANVAHPMMADEHAFAALRVEALERRFTHRGDDATAYDLHARYGTTYNHAALKAEGEMAHGKLESSRTELLWSHAAAAYWDTQLGVRVDNGEGANRQWLAVGVQGLAPYWFELDATAYFSSAGRTALRLDASYELLFTQRLILEPQLQLQLYGKDDPERGIGKGLAEASAGVRLRYEINRQFAPYLGVERAGSFGNTADLRRAAGQRALDTHWLAGVRFWF